MININASYYPFFQEICREFSCNISDLESKRRGRNYVRAKSVCCRFLRLIGYSYPQTGKVLDKDHSSVMHACKKCESDPDLEEYAIKLFMKHRQVLKARGEDLIKKEIFKNELDRELIVNLYNKGESVEKIAKELGNTLDYIDEQLNYLRRVYTIKKVPDYKNNTTREIFFKKNKKKC